MPMRHQSDDAMDNNERTSKSSSTSEHIIDGARDRLRSSICSVRDSITNSEHSFLHWLLSNGLEVRIYSAVYSVVKHEYIHILQLYFLDKLFLKLSC